MDPPSVGDDGGAAAPTDTTGFFSFLGLAVLTGLA